jgi:sugar/nucleoside kinase (ribokinase family)
MASDFDVIVVGNYSVDLIFSGLPELPQLGKDVIGTGFVMTPGEAFICAVSMHRLGIKVGWAADFGNDDFSRQALRQAHDEGLDDSLFVLHDRPLRRVSAAASFPDERGFMTYYDPDPSIPAAIPAVVKARAKIVFIPGLYTGNLMAIGLKMMRAKQMSLVMDGNSSNGDIRGKNKECSTIRKAIKSIDIFLPNALEARRITGEQDLEAAIYKLGELCPVVVIKDGANGSYAYTKGQLSYEPAIAVKPIDTTGAGDNFNAGFIRAWLDGKPIETCLKWGNVVGGLSTTQLGGTACKINCELVNQILSQGGNQNGQ